MNESSETHDNVRDRILQAAIKAIDEGGESAVRVVAVARDAGVTQGMVSYYFRSRESLVAEAQQARFIASLADDNEYIAQLVESASSPAEFRAGLEKMNAVVLSPQRRPARQVRVATFGAAVSRQDLLESVVATHSTVVDRLSENLDRARERGFVRTDCDTRAVSLVLMGMYLGLFLSDIDPQRPDDGALSAALAVALDGFFVK